MMFPGQPRGGSHFWPFIWRTWPYKNTYVKHLSLIHISPKPQNPHQVPYSTQQKKVGEPKQKMLWVGTWDVWSCSSCRSCRSCSCICFHSFSCNSSDWVTFWLDLLSTRLTWLFWRRATSFDFVELPGMPDLPDLLLDLPDWPRPRQH